VSERLVTEPTTVRHHIGTCPACKSGLYAEVELVTEVHPPRLERDGKPVDCAHAVIVGCEVEHVCGREFDGEWEVGRRRLCGGFAVHPMTGAALTCDLDAGHCGPHRDGDTTWGGEK
jgi:hypothetical protein